jgi:hypothetical protein
MARGVGGPSSFVLELDLLVFFPGERGRAGALHLAANDHW